MDSDFTLHQPTYEWTVKVFSQVKKVLGLNIKLHGDPQLLHDGEIFVFNHFARIETFLPHYLIYQETGAFCRSIATSKLFEGDGRFARYLAKVGVISNDYERILPLLVGEIMRGHKVVIFPEGGMVKDRKVMNDEGQFRVYSKEGKISRKHHTGAALIAHALNTVKQTIVCAQADEDWQQIDQWLEMLQLDDRDQLLLRAHKPTTIIPSNITFYPINTDENFLYKQASFFNDDLSKQTKEELIIESNLLLKNTDMDMRLGKPIYLAQSQSWWEKKAQQFLSKNLESINHFFTLDGLAKPWVKIIQRTFKHSSGKIRDQYMEAIYQETTVNLHHLASTVLVQLFEREQYAIKKDKYCLCVYLAIKNLQLDSEINLHRGLKNPITYRALVDGNDEALETLLDAALANELVSIEQGSIVFQPKFGHELERGTARIKNTIQVYANEMAPISGAIKAVEQALSEVENIGEVSLSFHRHDDELRAYNWFHQYYKKARFDEINQKETATESARPFLMLQSKKGKNKQSKLGVVLVHGFLASPAEIKPMAEKFHDQGYPVYGVRLAGHGTSPVDLRAQHWEDWVQSVATACQILKAYVDKIVLLGFSTGSTASLYYASCHQEDLAAVIGINSPVKFRDKKMGLVPLIHGVSSVVRTVSPLEGVLPYRPNNSEHPNVNYKSIPVKGLYELLQMNDSLTERLENIRLPCLLMQSSQDPIITADSVSVLAQGLVNADVSKVEIVSKRHGILYESVGNTHGVILDYVDALLASMTTVQNSSMEEEA